MSLKTESRTLASPTATRLGAHHDGSGASFGLFSSVADAVELCLFDDAGQETRWGLERARGLSGRGISPTQSRDSTTAFVCTGRGTRGGRAL